MNQRQKKDTLTNFDKQVHSVLLKVLMKYFPLQIKARKLDEQLLWTILLYAATRRTTVEAACQALSEAPSGNRLREHLNEHFNEQVISFAEIEHSLSQALRAILPEKVKRELARQEWEVAGDWVDVCYYGETGENKDLIRRSVAKKGTTRFYSYATLSIINRRQRYTLAITLVRPGERTVEVVKRLLKQVSEQNLKISLSYWDKAFGTIEVMRYLKNRKVPYIIALAQRGGANGIKKLCTGRRSRYCRHRFKSAKAGEFKASVVVVCKYSKKKYKRPGVRYFCYAVNGIGRMKPRKVFVKYRRRFGIESGYRQLHQVRIRTAMKNARVRMIFIGIGLLLVNLYVLVRRMITARSEYGRRKRKIKLKFEILIREIERYIEDLLRLNRLLYCQNVSLYNSFVIY